LWKRSGRLLNLTAGQKFGATWRKGKGESEWAGGESAGGGGVQNALGRSILVAYSCDRNVCQQSMIGSKMSNNVNRV
jgi:hypothetical protein